MESDFPLAALPWLTLGLSPGHPSGGKIRHFRDREIVEDDGLHRDAQGIFHREFALGVKVPAVASRAMEYFKDWLGEVEHLTRSNGGPGRGLVEGPRPGKSVTILTVLIILWHSHFQAPVQ